MSLKVNEPQVIHETIDGEVVIINLATGNYYSLRDSGADIWRRLLQGSTESDIVAAYARAHESPSETIQEGVSGLIGELMTEGLLVPGDSAAETPGTPSEVEDVGAGSPFVAPVLEKFDDMQDLILLDPVHEVDEEAGWPRARANAQD